MNLLQPAAWPGTIAALRCGLRCLRHHAAVLRTDCSGVGMATPAFPASGGAQSVDSSYFFRSVSGMGLASWIICPAISVPSLFMVPSNLA
jgi:hypothetical protein